MKSRLYNIINQQSRFYNIYIIKKYGNSYKLILLNSLINREVESPFPLIEKKKGNKLSKLQNNISRAKATIYELAICNDWNYFVTLTIDPIKYDRSKLREYYKQLSKFINNYNYQNNCKIKYLLIPELHKDKKSWHMHGLIYNLPKNKLKENKNGFLDWEDYSKKFGYMSLSLIRDFEKTALYITKYITKDTLNNSIEYNKHLFYSSQGLKRAEELFRGRIYCDNVIQYDFTNEYLSLKNLNREELEKLINESELKSL